LSGPAAGAQIKLNIELRDVNTNKSVTDALVIVRGITMIQEPNREGKFTVTVRTPGTYKLEVVAANYERQVLDVVVESGQESRDIQIALEPTSTLLQAVEVTALRADERTPIAKADVSKQEITERNSARDIPFLLEQTPSVVATSDAGAGIGYTNIRVRGSDITRINVTVNGIP
jgi:iron complex outermembrane receptor protein